MNNDFSRLERHVERLDGRVGQLEVGFARLEARMDGLESRMDDLEIRMGTLETKMESLEKTVKSEFSSLKKWLIGVGVGFCALIVGILALQTTWIVNDSNRNWEIANKAIDRIDAMQQKFDREIASRPYPHP